jgi:hypothetical protein
MLRLPLRRRRVLFCFYGHPRRCFIKEGEVKMAKKKQPKNDGLRDICNCCVERIFNTYQDLPDKAADAFDSGLLFFIDDAMIAELRGRSEG